MTVLSPLPIQKFFDNNARPLVGGQLFTYVAGTSTKVATWKDSAGASLNTNPISLDFRGECRIWLDPALTYKFVLAPANDTDPPTNPIWTVDNIQSGITFASLTALILGQILYPRNSWEIYANVTPSYYPAFPSQGYSMSVWRFMTASQIASALAFDGLVSHTSAIQAANDFLEGRSAGANGGQPHPGGRLYFPLGLYNVLNAETLRVGGNVVWVGDQFQGAVLNFASTTNTANAIVMGPDNSGFFGYSGIYTMGTAIERMRISLDPQNQFSAVIATAGAHQGSHLKQLKIEGCNQRGISLGNTGGPAYFWAEDINIQGGARDALPLAREGIFTQVGGLFRGREITVEGAAGHNFSIGVRVNNGGSILENLHFENGVDGVYYDNQAGNNCASQSIVGISGNSTMTNLVHIPNPCNQTVTVENVTGITGDPSHPVAIRNDVTGEALLNTNVGKYSWSGDASGARAGAFGYSALHNTPHIRYGKSAVQAIPQNTFTVLTFPTKLDDSFNVGEWSGSVYTPKIPGRYRVTVSLAFASTTWAAGSIFRLYIVKTGAGQSTYEDDSAVGTFVRQLQHTDTVNCAAGDTISTGVFQGVTASLNTDSSGVTCYIAIDRE